MWAYPPLAQHGLRRTRKKNKSKINNGETPSVSDFLFSCRNSRTLICLQLTHLHSSRCWRSNLSSGSRSFAPSRPHVLSMSVRVTACFHFLFCFFFSSSKGLYLKHVWQAWWASRWPMTRSYFTMVASHLCTLWWVTRSRKQCTFLATSCIDLLTPFVLLMWEGNVWKTNVLSLFAKWEFTKQTKKQNLNKKKTKTKQNQKKSSHTFFGPYSKMAQIGLNVF